MNIMKVSPLSGVEHTMDLDVTVEQLKRHEDGEFAQVAFPNLSAAEREFLITGITPEEWDKMFKED